VVSRRKISDEFARHFPGDVISRAGQDGNPADGGPAMPAAQGSAPFIVKRGGLRSKPFGAREIAMAGLSTHVLDIVRGGPAEGVGVELFSIGEDGARLAILRTRTNADGRTDAPLISAADARIGTFELIFHIGDYFRRSGAKTAEPAFLDVIPIRFSVADPKTHYHVPLLASPWSYSTYRGS
jgi:5-hydroxyisourate hydrolase